MANVVSTAEKGLTIVEEGYYYSSIAAESTKTVYFYPDETNQDALFFINAYMQHAFASDGTHWTGVQVYIYSKKVEALMLVAYSQKRERSDFDNHNIMCTASNIYYVKIHFENYVGTPEAISYAIQGLK